MYSTFWFFSASDQWLTDGCTKINYCINGTYSWEDRPCGANANCVLDEYYNYQCACKTVRAKRHHHSAFLHLYNLKKKFQNQH